MNVEITADYTVPSDLSRMATENGLHIYADTSEDSISITFPVPTHFPITIHHDGGDATNDPITVIAADGTTLEGEASITIRKTGDAQTFYPASATTWGTDQPAAAEVEAEAEAVLVASNVETDWVTTPIALTSAQIRAIYTTPPTLVSAPGANYFLEVDYVRLKFTNGATPYTSGDDTLLLDLGGNVGTSVSTTMLTDGIDCAITVRNFEHMVVGLEPSGQSTAFPRALNQPLRLAGFTQNPADGDGTIAGEVRWRKVLFEAVA